MSSVAESRPSQIRARKAGLVLGGIALLSGLTLTGIRVFSGSASKLETSTVLGVEVVMLSAADDLTVSRVYTGQVEAGRASELGFQQGGELVEILVDRGESVVSGQPLARLSVRRLRAQRAQLEGERERALAQLEELQNGPRQEDIAAAQATVQDLEHQLDLERLRQERREFLYDQGALSREERDVVAFNFDALQERISAERSQLEALQTGTRPEQITAQQATVQQLSAGVEDLDIAIENNTLVAPFSGVIAARRLDEGAIVQAGQSVLRLVEQSEMEIDIGLPIDVVINLRLGQPQRVTVNSNTYEASVAAILPEIDATTQTQTVVLQLTGLEDVVLPPDQLAQMEIAQIAEVDGFWLPITALIQGERGLWAVYALNSTIDGDNNRFRIERREVELLHTQAERVFVRGVLDVGDAIVADGTQRLVPGQIVRLAP
ncbi:efflux RND transporter periplasmic adaptor subunit [Leptolyngbyaceae cyanobacterium CCMR0082]|uniref:Efflux RND transporter periplasmic adaptor subunit n=1 Tax=Adonisia turfae CCMR0082 TaxID=2304604 RepID=A0A6M0S5I6_9CYAN|nr:efflux RND transporter periplasmic adaptor subunit [Adonisia turfae]NEZ63620.1 efflux RND transporter periplasmic adaptor subunit [Adonisia turfae CCMR0082]